MDDTKTPIANITHCLKTQREALYLTEKDVSIRLRLNINTILSLENGKIMDSPPTIFTRGYLRAYAQFLNLPEKDIQLALASWENALPPDPMPMTLACGNGSTPFEPPDKYTKNNKEKTIKSKYYIRILTYFIFCILTVVVIKWSQSPSRYAMIPEHPRQPPIPIAQAPFATTNVIPPQQTPSLLSTSTLSTIQKNNKPVIVSRTKTVRPIHLQMALPEPDN